MVLLASTETEIFTTFPSPLEINTKHARLSTPNTKIRGKTHLFLFFALKDKSYGSILGDKNKKSEVYPGSDEIKENNISRSRDQGHSRSRNKCHN